MDKATATSGAPLSTARQTDSHVIPIFNQKGGIGKTMVTLGLAAHTAHANGRCLVVDVDPQANAHDLTAAMDNPGYDVVYELDPQQLAGVRKIREYDTVFVDCPGSLEGRDVITQVLEHSDFVIVPYDHTPESITPTVRSVEKVREADVPYAVVLTKADPRLGADFVLDAWKTLESVGIRHFRSVIRWYRAWPNSLQAGAPITRHNERYAPKVREDLGRLHTELLLDLGRRGT